MPYEVDGGRKTSKKDLHERVHEKVEEEEQGEATEVSSGLLEPEGSRTERIINRFFGVAVAERNWW